MRPATFLFALILFATACGGQEPTMPSATADTLAAQADAIAATLAEGDHCGATDQIATLRDDIAAQESSGALPEALAEELTVAVADLQGQITCEPEPQPEDDGDRDEGKGNDEKDEDEKDEDKKEEDKKEEEDDGEEGGGGGNGTKGRDH